MEDLLQGQGKDLGEADRLIVQLLEQRPKNKVDKVQLAESAIFQTI